MNIIGIIYKYWVEVIISFITSFLLCIIKQYIGIRFGMRALLKNEIIRIYETYVKLGYCPSFIKENIKDIYYSYHKLKGNGMCTSMVNEIYKLPNELRED